MAGPRDRANTDDPYRYGDGPKTNYYATFDPSKFDALLKANGLFFRWQRAIDCSCRLNTETDQPDPTCIYCLGGGWRLINPEYWPETVDPAVQVAKTYYRVQIAFANVALDPTIQNMLGSWTFGDGLLSVPGYMRVTFRDRFIGEQQVMGWSELLVRKDSAIVSVGKMGRSREDQEAAMRYEPFEINYVEQVDGDDRTIFEEDVDYVFVAETDDEPGHMEWLDGRGPAVGAHYAVHYNCHPVWVIDDAVYATQHVRGQQRGIAGRKDTVQFLPTTFKVRLDYLTDRRGS